MPKLCLLYDHCKSCQAVLLSKQEDIGDTFISSPMNKRGLKDRKVRNAITSTDNEVIYPATKSTTTDHKKLIRRNMKILFQLLISAKFLSSQQQHCLTKFHRTILSTGKVILHKYDTCYNASINFLEQFSKSDSRHNFFAPSTSRRHHQVVFSTVSICDFTGSTANETITIKNTFRAAGRSRLNNMMAYRNSRRANQRLSKASKIGLLIPGRPMSPSEGRAQVSTRYAHLKTV